MRYVGYDQFCRRPAEAGFSRPQAGGLLTPTLLFASVALLVLSRVDHGYISGARVAIAEAVSPVLRTIMIPLEPLRAAGAAARLMFARAGDVERLANENQRLKGWETRAKDLERQLADLGAVAKTARDSDIAFVTARVMATSSGPFVRSAMINAGAGEQIKAGYPVLAGDGLAGRVAVAGQGVSRLLLLTDADSRIPVFVGPLAVRAVLAGDNGAAPRLVFLAPGVTVNAGDEVTTSSIGGIFPRGLRIGTVAGSGARPPVALHSDLDRLEYVSVLFYEPGGAGLPPLEERPPADGAGVAP
jgi:rod shape-determining protein MreC